MPVYVYRNLNTNETFEIEQRITEAALTHHPETGDPVKRLIQPVGIAFKGSGFYVTDSRNKGAAKKTSTSSDSSDTSVKADSDSSQTDSKADSKTDSKADSKTDSKADSKTDSKKDTSSKKDSSSSTSSSPSN